MIPVFIIFLPFGIIQFLRKKIENTSFIITFLIISSIPIFYAYLVQAQDTRYLYVLYPIFCVISIYPIEKIMNKINATGINIVKMFCFLFKFL